MFQSIEYKHPKFYQVFRIFIVILASIIFAWNLCCFARPAGLFPGGFSGLSLLLQEIFQKFLHIHVPYTLLNVLLNIIPVYIGFKFIGRKFTLYSILTIILSSIFVDILPAYVFAEQCVRRSDQRIRHQSVSKCRHNNRRYRLHQHLSVPAQRN